MERLVVLGAGTAGTMVVNKLRRRLPRSEWSITVVDPATEHHYQPGYLFVPFGTYTPDQVTRPLRPTIRSGVELVRAEVERVDPDARLVHLTDGTTLDYDWLVIATGTTPRPAETPGLAEGLGTTVHEFYTLPGATALADALQRFTSGRLVVHVTEMPIKCPVAPLEFAFLVDDHLTRRGIRDAVELTYVTPLPGAFTKPVSAALLGDMLARRGITLEPDFVVESIDPDARTLTSYDERTVEFDLLVTVPVNMGADYVSRSGLGDELGYVPVDKHTLLAKASDRIFVVGDASDAPASKAGSVAHFQVDLFVHNFLDHVAGRPMTEDFDGHANCFVESGAGKALLIDFNYDTEPLPGNYPFPVVGPMRLLKESRLNHWGKLAFRWLYWHMLLPGRRLPIPTKMSMTGKRRLPAAADTETTVRIPDGF